MTWRLVINFIFYILIFYVFEAYSFYENYIDVLRQKKKKKI